MRSELPYFQDWSIAAEKFLNRYLDPPWPSKIQTQISTFPIISNPYLENLLHFSFGQGWITHVKNTPGCFIPRLLRGVPKVSLWKIAAWCSAFIGINTIQFGRATWQCLTYLNRLFCGKHLWQVTVIARETPASRPMNCPIPQLNIQESMTGTSPRMNDIVNLLAAFVGLRFEQAENQVLCCTAMVEIPVCFLPRFTCCAFSECKLLFPTSHNF